MASAFSIIFLIFGKIYSHDERFVRESAKEFGSDAAATTDGYKLLLSQFAPSASKSQMSDHSIRAKKYLRFKPDFSI